MVEYLKTKKGYFYKLKKNGEKKRISQEEYNKKKNKTRKNKTRKNKKMIGGASLNMLELMMGRADDLHTDTEREQIEQSDIMYKDDLVCILKPDVKKGIIVFTNYKQPPGVPSICEVGLKTGKQLQSEKIDFGRTKIHPHIFFRAPFYSREIDYTSVETEINSSYGEKQSGIQGRVYIRVDPDKTFVFSSELRATKPDDIEKSKKLLSDYLKIIDENAKIYKTLFPLTKTYKQPAYHLFTSKLIPVPNNGKTYTKISYPLNNAPIERNSEILVSIPNLTPEYFVLCTS
tara:strand:+ start:89 stop:952 length:864 start_codon:yes stop_codon:yes gene_type:complete